MTRKPLIILFSLTDKLTFHYSTGVLNTVLVQYLIQSGVASAMSGGDKFQYVHNP